MIKTVIFDFDGTLVDSKNIAITIYNDLAQNYGYKKISSADISYIAGLSMRDRCKYLGVPFQNIPHLLRKVTKKYKGYLSTIHMEDQIIEAVSKLRNEGFQLAIISSNSEDIIKKVLEKNNINLFSQIYSSKNLFGKHFTINTFINKAGLSKREVIYVGDELRDIVSCKKCGVKVIAVTWGFDSADLLLKEGPDYLVHKPSEMIDIVKSIS